MNTAIENKLLELLPGRVRFNVPLADMTSYRLGGEAWVLAEPDSPEELRCLMAFVRSEELTWFILGGGSNVLFADEGFPGVVIRLGSGFSDIRIMEETDDFRLVEAGSAVPTAVLVSKTRREGLSGIEFLAGIPGRIGGALAMNAGASGGEIVQVLKAITVFTREMNVSVLDSDCIEAGYRHLSLPSGAVILSAVFRLTPDRPGAVEEKVRQILKRRSAGHPKGLLSAGCVFKNPSGESAGRLIDMAGLKGLANGGAWVAREHANFIVHDGRASAKEVLELMARVRDTVRDKYRVELEPEIKIVDKNGKVGRLWPD